MESFEIREIGPHEAIPYSLLLDADPSESMVNSYLSSSRIYLLILAARVIGVYVLQETTDGIVEIKNIAVSDEFQRRGLGTIMIADAEKKAIIGGYRELHIATGNSSIWQLYLYQKLGFEVCSIKLNFFVDNYPEPLFENGIRVKHMIVLKKQL